MMSPRSFRLIRVSLVVITLFITGYFSLSLLHSTARANGPSGTIVLVEEDWELVVGTPDANSVAPQVTCVFSPTSNFDTKYAAFELNHKSQPSFVGGGLQLQIWDGECACSSQASPVAGVISSSGDTIQWTQTMALVNGQLVFNVTNGSSTTWGSFGNLQAVTSTSLPNLNAYSADLSADNSGVGYAANRVQSFVLKRVRLITDTGEVFEDTVPRVVHPSN